MIREKRLFCKLLAQKKSAQELYAEEKDGRPGACPCCGSRDRWAEHGRYKRNLIDHIGGKAVYARIKVRRVRCESCGHTHALLPDYIVPYLTYSLFFVLRVLAEHDLARGTVAQLCRRYSITPSMLYQWKRLFALHKEIWLGVLESAETTPAQWIRRLITLPDYSTLFAAPFFRTAARSFLQGHKDAARFRRAVF